ncbi:UrcA family protein [Hyphomonas sp.]|uniref:UrcA family protein n=1 Tax=Hyphomonas sp. TaxID=87 RepID=UPI0035634CCA
MLKPIVSIMAAAMFLSPLAVAGEQKPITVSIAYDKDMLATKSGAAEVLDAITDQAKEACTTYVPVFGGDYTDRKCVSSIVSSAVSKIRDQQALEGRETAGEFASSDVVILADAEQR